MKWLMAITSCLSVGCVSLGLWAPVKAAEASAETSVQPSQAVEKNAAPAQLTPAQWRAEWLKTLAAIAEEEAQPQPDQAKLASLREKLQTLRVAPAPAAPNPVAMGCPWGGPGLGLGLGRGPGWAAGRGYGRGPARGYSRPATVVPPGGGRGYGMGPYFIDQNHNGICDYYESRWGW